MVIVAQSIVLVFVVCASLHAEVIAIRNARVIDGTGAPARVEAVVIRDSRIAAAGPDVAIPRDARVIDAAGKTLLPGIFDLHTHLSSSGVAGISADWGKNLLAYLAAGVTTVNDYSAYGEMFEPQRKLLESGAVAGPKVQLAHRLSTPGGHGMEGGWGDFFTLTASTAQEAHAQMKRILPYKPDVIKIFTDGWRYGTAPDLSSMNEETIAAIAADAHAAGIRVFTHTVTLRGAKIAARAGIDALAHGIGDAPVDDELIGILKAKGTFYISTLAVYEPRSAGAMPPAAVRFLEPAAQQLLGGAARSRKTGAPAGEIPSPRAKRWTFLLDNVRRLHEAGVGIACGTDAGVTGAYHGYATLRELELLVRAGLSPMDAIVAGTLGSARAAGMERDRGTIAAGKIADLVLVDGKPDERIEDVEKTWRVFLGGREMDPREIERKIARPEMTALPVHPVAARIDDMEDRDRTSLGTLRVDETDDGPDHSRLMFEPISRESGGQSLMLEAQLAAKEAPYVRLDLPLTKGGIDLANVSAYRGISFLARGECSCRVVMDEYKVRNRDFFQASFPVSGKWTKVKIPFSDLHTRAKRDWNPQDLREIEFELAGPAGSRVWLELDDVEFY